MDQGHLPDLDSLLPSLGLPLNVNKQGMAQHYGLATDLLDFTSNFDVASFFATCCWDHGTGEYTPMLRSERPGVIYRIFPAIFVGTDQDAEFEIVGWQPLKRPAQQRAFGLKLKKDQNLGALPTVQMIKFRHCAKTSTRIWQAFDEGRALFPNDAAAELSEQARRLRQFTRQQVNKAWGRLDTWNRQSSLTNYRQTVEKNSGIIISETTILSWDGLDVERDEVKLVNDLNNILNSVRYRMAIYPK